MSQFHKSIHTLTTLEDLANRNTPVHRLNPFVKFIITGIYLVLVISFAPNQVSGLIPYVFYPVLMMAFGEIPAKPLIGRLLAALPFSLFAGLSNVIFNRTEILQYGNIVITEGMISFISIIMKTALTVMAVLILIATTSMKDLIYVMVRLHLPSIFVLQITMTFRYLEVLLEEASVMYHAYLLRAPKEKGIKLVHTGPFLGQLLLRSFDRAERIYNAMRCRGFEGGIRFSGQEKIRLSSMIFLFAAAALMIAMRFVNISEIIGKLFV